MATLRFVILFIGGLVAWPVHDHSLGCDEEECQDIAALLQSRAAISHDSWDGLGGVASNSAEGESLMLTVDDSNPFADVTWPKLQAAVHDYEAFLMMPSSNRQDVLSSTYAHVREALSQREEQFLKDKLTSVQCIGSSSLLHNRSCTFKNLYFNQDDGGFFVFSLEDTIHPDFSSVMLLPKWSTRGRIQRKDFRSLADFGDFVEEHQPRVHEGLSLIYDTLWHFNIAYALWDGLYPAFLSLREWGRHTEKFRSVVGLLDGCEQSTSYSNSGDGKCMSESAFKAFGGGEFLPYMQLTGTGWHCFSDSIAGSGRKGFRSINHEYALPGGRGLDGARLFRDRMYTSHGLAAPTARSSSSVGQSLPLRGIIVNNGRFKQTEVELLKTVAEQLSSQKLKLEYIDYRAGALAGNFTKHLELIGTLTFHISGPGTSQSYGPFLPDGGIHLNLGNRRPIDGSYGQSMEHRTIGGFLEEQWSEGVPYLRAVHYDPLGQQPPDFQQSELTSLIHRAVDLVESDFAIPVSPGENLSPIARVFTEYCSAIGASCDDLLRQMNGDLRENPDNDGAHDPELCLVGAWAELVVFEEEGWSEAGKETDGVTEHCLLQRKVLRQIRARHFGW